MLLLGRASGIETQRPGAGGGVEEMLFQCVVFGLPAVEFDGAEEALRVVCAIGDGAVVEAGFG